MYISELIERLTNLLHDTGDMEVLLDSSPDGLNTIDEVDVDAECDNVIIWAGDQVDDDD